ncbi:MAG: hypothetical protein M3Q34_02595 [bacterium]|nr:hypothetical protein [bacterium]
MKNKMFLSGLLMCALILPVAFINAATFLPKSVEDSGNVVVSGEEEYKNLYIAGGTIVVNKNILGDLFSVGSSINVGGEIEQDLLAIAGNIFVTSPILGDARMAGGNITVNAPVGGDLLVVGGTILINKNVTVAGDLWLAGQMTNINGSIAGDVKVLADEVFINGTINGNLEVDADQKLTFGTESKVLGSIVYSGKNEPVIQDGAQVGTIERKIVEKKSESAGSQAIGFIAELIMNLLTLFVAVSVILWLFKKRVQTILSSYEFSFSNKFWRTVGVGFLSLVFIPIVSLILMVTMVGMYLGIVLFVWYVLAILMSVILSCILLGGMVQKFQKSRDNTEGSTLSLDLSWKTALIGVLALGILCLIPILGGIAIALVIMSAFGTIVLTIKEKVMH